MKKQLLSLALVFILLANCSNAQNIFPSTGSAGIGTATPNASAILEIKSSTKGMLVPRMTKASRDAIAVPATGLLIYQTNNTPGFYYYSGTAWTVISSTGANTSLSNLSGPVKVNVNLLPDSNQMRNLGSAAVGWKNIYYTGNLFSSGNRTIATANDGLQNTFLGLYSGLFNTTGYLNTGNGYSTLNANTSGSGNTATGALTLYVNTIGSYNTANGTLALKQNIDGSNNTADGNSSLSSNINGSYNTAQGTSSLYANTTGTSNTANGFASLYNNSTGNNNTASGYQALYSNSDGINNTATGFQALIYATGSSNSAFGAEALYSTTTGFNNTACGQNALYLNSTGSSNTAIGTLAMYGNATGGYNTACGLQALQGNSTGFHNTAVGAYALQLNTTGGENIAMGYEALLKNTTGQENVAIGIDALNYNTDGYFNVGIGYRALYFNDVYGGNTAIGSSSDVIGYSNSTAIGDGAEVFGGSNGTNATAIGYNAVASASNTMRLGNSQVTSIGGYVNWSNISDGRYKKNIKPNVPGLDFIKQLKPITYNLDITGINNHIDKLKASVKSPDGKELPLTAQDKDGIKAKEQIVYSGFIAQEVEATAKKMGYNFSGVDAPKNENDLYGLRYAEFVVPLVKAVQELSKMNDDKNEIIQQQNNKIDDLEVRLAKLEAMMNVQQSTINNKQQTSNLFSASLEQNTPNPFSSTTAIHYVLPQKFSKAKIIITDKNGKVLKQLSVTGVGKGSLNVDALTLSSGAYNYSFYVDGKLIGSKQMVIAK